ncbi:hypothetical protein N9F00_00865 [Planktomarina temperata]|jgi:hypothetical protein|nr:hypothetical protein [Planktomarina temperata]
MYNTVYYLPAMGGRLHTSLGRGIHDEAHAAKSLLKAFWFFDKHECDTDRPHRCNAAALSDEALEGIMDAVWEGE